MCGTKDPVAGSLCGTAGPGQRDMEDDWHLYGVEDEFESQFADELEVLSELNVPTHDDKPSKTLKESKFRQGKQTFEEAIASGDVVSRNEPSGRILVQEHNELQDSTRDPAPQKRNRDVLHLPREEELHDNLQHQDEEQGLTPKHKKPRLDTVKRLEFESLVSPPELHPSGDEITPPSSPDDLPQIQHPRCPKTSAQDILGISDVVPMEEFPVKVQKRVLKRPPVMEDYIKVTSTDGTRVYLVLEDEDAGQKSINTHRWSGQRQLHLLGVPFSYLKEQVAEEHRRQVIEESQRLSEMLSSQIDKEFGEEEETAAGEEETAAGEDEAVDEINSSSLWVDRFTPRQYTELLSDDYTNRCLLKWLKLWDTVVFGREKIVRKSKPVMDKHSSLKQSYPQQQQQQQNKWKTKAQITEEMLDAELDAHNRPKCKVALLSGPPGLGKTTLAHVIASHAGYNVVEMNASDDRSPEIFKTRIESATQMKSVLGANEKPNCLIIDEIDGAPTAAINTLLSLVNRKDGKEAKTPVGAGTKKKKEGGILRRPIICICNDQYVPSLRQLRQQAFTLVFPPTLPSRLVQRLNEIANKKGMKADLGILMSLCDKAENDIRSCVNTLQFLHGRGTKELSMKMIRTTTIGLKDQNKSLFSVWQEIFQLPKLQRARISQEGSSQSEMWTDGDQDPLNTAARIPISATAQRFNHILHLSISTGEHEKITRGLYDNFLSMRFKDPSFSGVCLALEWLEFTDILNEKVMSVQNFQLMRYLPFLPVAFHMLFAATNVARISYPNSHYEAQAKQGQMQNLLMSMVGEISPAIRSRLTLKALVSEILCLMLDILSPKLRPVNTQLYSAREKQQLADLIGAMLSYNLTYHQERTLEGQYIYLLDPNVEDVCRFPDLPARRPMTYQAKQLIAREIELEKMRRVEALLNARNTDKKETGDVNKKPTESKKGFTSCVKNHKQSLEKVLKSATVRDETERDFFGRRMDRKNIVSTSTVTGNAEPVVESAEKFIGKAVGKSDVWFRFNEGMSNAVRRNVYIKDLL